MPSFRKTTTPGVYVRHEKSCPRSETDESGAGAGARLPIAGAVDTR
jgi:hypothetical protein